MRDSGARTHYLIRSDRCIDGFTSEDREMLELAHRKFYRWREIHDYSEALASGVQHPESVGSQ